MPPPQRCLGVSSTFSVPSLARVPGFARSGVVLAFGYVLRAVPIGYPLDPSTTLLQAYRFY